MSDRYGLAATFAFETSPGTFASMTKVETHLKSIEQAVKSTQQTVVNSSIGASLQQGFQAAGGAMSQAQNQVIKTSQGFANMTRQLRPLRDEFRALRGEARNIEFGDLSDPSQFDGAKKAIRQYITELKQLESQITGTSAAERALKADFQSQQRIAESKIEQATSQRSAARASDRQGKGVAIAAAGAAVTAPLVGFGANALKITQDFDDQLKQIAAVTDPAERTQKNLEQIEMRAKLIGAQTKFSASDAASGFVLLAQAGFDVQKQLAAIDGVTNLAAAGNLDLADATSYVVSGLGQFNLKADQAIRFADVMAQTAGKAQVDVADLGGSLKNAGAAASAFGASPEKTMALLGALSEIGIKGPEAGTALRNVFQTLSKAQSQPLLAELGVSATDASGQFKDITVILRELDKATTGLTESERAMKLSKLFGVETYSAGLGLLQRASSGAIDSYEKFNMTAKGVAASQGQLMESGIGGAMRNLSSAYEGMQIEIGQKLVPILNLAANALSALLMGFINLPDPIKQGIVVAGVLAAGLGTLAVVVGTGIAAFSGLELAMANSALASGILSKSVLPLTGYFQTAISSIGAGGFSSVLLSASQAAGVLSASAATLGTAISAGLATALTAITSPIGLVVGAVVALYAVLEILTPGINILSGVLSAIAAPIGFVTGLIAGMAQGIWQGLKPAIDILVSTFEPLNGAINGAFGGIGEAVGAAIASFQSMFGTGQQVGVMLGQVIVAPFTLVASTIQGVVGLIGSIASIVTAPFNLVSSVVTETLMSITTSWKGFIGWLTDSLMAIPNAVSGAFSKILPPFMRKGEDEKNQATAVAGAATPPTPPSPPAQMAQSIASTANRVLPFAGLMRGQSKSADKTPSPVQSATTAPTPSSPVIEQSIAGSGQFGLPLAVVPSLQPFAADVLSQVGQQLSQVKAGLNGKIDSMLNFTPSVDPKPVEQLANSVKGLGSQFSGAAIAAIGLGVTSLGALSPAILVLATLGFGVLAIATNFLGLRTIAKSVGQVVAGAFNIARGGIELVIGTIQSAMNLGKGLLQVMGGIPAAIMGDFSKITQGFDTMKAALSGGATAIKQALSRMGQGAGQIFKGLIGTVKGLGEAVSQVTKGTIGTIRALPNAVSTVSRSIRAVWEGTGKFVQALKLVPKAMGGLMDLPELARGKLSEIRQLFTTQTRRIASVWDAIQLRLPEVNLAGLRELPERVKGFADGIKGIWNAIQLRLPEVNLAGLQQIPERVKGFVDGIKGIWNAIQLRLPEVNLAGLRELPEQVKGFVDGIKGIWNAIQLRLPEVNLADLRELPERVTGIVDGIKGIWSAIQLRLPEVNLAGIRELPELVKTLINSVTAVFQNGVEKISAIWGGLSEKFTGTLDRMGGVAKKIGKGFIRDLSENSPGPTFQIRAKWAMTTERVSQNLHGLSQVAGVAGRAIGAEISAGAAVAASKASGKLAGLQAKMLGLKDSKGGAALSRTSSSLGMALSNFAPQLAMPLFAIGDLVDTAQTLSETLPETRKMIQGLGPAFSQVKERAMGLLPVLKSGFTTALESGKTAATAIIPVVQMMATQMVALFPVVIAQLGAMASAFVAMAGTAMAAITPIILPFLPVVAAVGAVIGVIALLKAAFDNNFLGFRSLIEGVGESIKSALLFPFKLTGTIAAGVVEQIQSRLSQFSAWMIGTVGESIKSALLFPFKLTGAIAASAMDQVKASVSNLFTWAISQVVALPSLIMQSINQLMNGIGGSILNLINPLQIVGSAVDFVMSRFGAAAEWVTGAWQGFGDWFGGAMGGLVTMGENAGVGLINALNHNPTVRIPLAWEKATSNIVGMMVETVNAADSMGGGMVGTFRAVGSAVQMSIVGSLTNAKGAASAFAFNAVLAMAPVALAAFGVGLIVMAIGNNFLGLRDVAQGALQIVQAAVQGVTAVLRGLWQIIQSVGQILKGVFIGDFTMAMQGFQGIAQGVSGIASGLASAIQMAFGGMVTAVSGFFNGLAGGVDRFFRFFRIQGVNTTQIVSSIGSAFMSVGAVIRSAIESPKAAWQSFLGLIDKVETGIRGVAQSIAQSPLGKFTRAATDKVQGRAASIPNAQIGVNFDDELSARNPAPNIAAPAVSSFRQKLGNMFGRRGGAPTPEAVPEVIQAATQVATAPIDQLTTARTQQAPTPGIPAPSVVQAARTQQAQTEAPPDVAAQVQDVRTQGVNAVTDVGSALQGVISVVAPGLSGMFGGVMNLVMSFASLGSALPALAASYTAAGGAAGIWSALTTGAVAMVSTGYAGLIGWAGAMWGTIVTAYTTAGGAAGIWALLTTGASALIAGGFAAVGAAASFMWIAVTGPLLPIIAAIVAVAVVIGATVMAIKNNFLGLGDVFGGVWQAIQANFGEIFGIIKSAWDDSIGGIGAQLQILRQVFVDAFQPFMALFGGEGGGGLGGAIKGALFVATFQIRILAFAIGGVIRTIGNLITGFVVVAQVIASIFVTPLRAVFQAAGDIKNSLGGLFNAFTAPFKPLIDRVVQFFSFFKQGTTQSAQGLGALKLGLEMAFLPLRLVGFLIAGAIRLIGFAISSTIKGVEMLVNIMLLPVRAATMLGDALIGAGMAIGSAIMVPIQAVSQFLSGIVEFVMSIPTMIADAIGMAFQQVQQFIGGIGQAIAGIPVIGGLFSLITGVQPAATEGAGPVQKFAKGGPVDGGSGVSDTISALLTHGEFVVAPEAAQKYRGILPLINAGQAGFDAIAGFIAQNVGSPADGTSPLQSIPQFLPIPLPQAPASSGFALAGAGDAGGVTIPKVEVNLNVEKIVIGGGGGQGGNQQSTQAMAMELLESLRPHLEFAMTDILREMIDKTR